MTEPTSAGWYRDPFGRHERRYHTGTGWTEHVRDRSRAGIDPPQEAPATAPVTLRIPAPPRPPVRPPNGHGNARSGKVAVAAEPLTVADWPTPSNVPPSGATPPPPTPPRSRRRWPWLVMIVAGVAVGAGLGLVLTTGGSSSPRRRAAAPAPAQLAPHTIADPAYVGVRAGTTRNELVQSLGETPAPRADLVARFPSMRFDPACVYYFGRGENRTYSFCFSSTNTLNTKKVDVQVARAS